MTLQNFSFVVTLCLFSLTTTAQQTQERTINKKGKFSEQGVIINGKLYHLINLVSMVEGRKRKEIIPLENLKGRNVNVKGTIYLDGDDVYDFIVTFKFNKRKYKLDFEKIEDDFISGNLTLFAIK